MKVDSASRVVTNHSVLDKNFRRSRRPNVYPLLPKTINRAVLHMQGSTGHEANAIEARTCIAVDRQASKHDNIVRTSIHGEAICTGGQNSRDDALPFNGN